MLPRHYTNVHRTPKNPSGQRLCPPRNLGVSLRQNRCRKGPQGLLEHRGTPRCQDPTGPMLASLSSQRSRTVAQRHRAILSWTSRAPAGWFGQPKPTSSSEPGTRPQSSRSPAQRQAYREAYITCSGPLDRRAQAEVASALRTDTLTDTPTCYLATRLHR